MNLALIGCGSRSQRLAAAAADLGHTIAVCADTHTAHAKRTATRFRAKFTPRPIDAVKTAEAVLIAEPAPAYVAPAVRALQTHVPVYWDAPFANDPRTARKLLDAAKAAKSVLVPAYAPRRCPQYAAAARQIAAGAIGKVGFIRVHRHAPHDAAPTLNGAALDSLAGDFDFIAATFGPVATIYAQLVRKKPVDSALLTLTLVDGPIVQCAASLTPNDRGPAHAAIELCGATGMIQFTTHEPILHVHSHSARQPRVATSPITPDATTRRLELFFNALAQGRIATAQLKHELHVVHIVEAALDSARTGRAVKVKR